jgi:hypothetical protein
MKLLREGGGRGGMGNVGFAERELDRSGAGDPYGA